MPIVIIDKTKGYEVKRVSKEDWETMKTVIRWKEMGIWETVKTYVYNHNLLRKTGKFKDSKNKVVRRGFLRKLIEGKRKA